MKLQGRIESLKREFEFVSRLSSDDVAHIMQMKREQAARQI